ncbi:hypothetical protein PPTG_12559 [Phytophthora nicotianae INRA-310]|uniref:Uncharacterized protein n=1 Tax=Phytophthora nicotianae (strain INRA-310) TaxID=761204 RepID=W2Q4D2_PHYN3|nr:hypothetical protein PPTG_12559 [Phytophthora nicotianae INRA-310]ETN08053.1 hypothetical protein PPTG_12559 [Phytophthora nicotianae INRA-310]
MKREVSQSELETRLNDLDIGHVISSLEQLSLYYFTDVQGDLASNEEGYGRNLDGCRSLLDDFNNARTSQQNDGS